MNSVDLKNDEIAIYKIDRIHSIPASAGFDVSRLGGQRLG
jgi:hypothetical protein